jgi:hypothetical protein
LRISRVNKRAATHGIRIFLRSSAVLAYVDTITLYLVVAALFGYEQLLLS